MGIRKRGGAFPNKSRGKKQKGESRSARFPGLGKLKTEKILDGANENKISRKERER
jgi:hypothetical protein